MSIKTWATNVERRDEIIKVSKELIKGIDEALDWVLDSDRPDTAVLACELHQVRAQLVRTIEAVQAAEVDDAPSGVPSP